jgi:hypothetical protein
VAAVGCWVILGSASKVGIANYVLTYLPTKVGVCTKEGESLDEIGGGGGGGGRRAQTTLLCCLQVRHRHATPSPMEANMTSFH